MNKETKMNQFESSLLTQLNAVADGRSAHKPLLRRPAFVALPAGAAGIAAAAIIGVGALSGASAAYAVTTASDGDVVVTINSLSDAAGLQSQLRSDGIDANVSYDAGTTTPPGASAGQQPALAEGVWGVAPTPGAQTSTSGPGPQPGPDGLEPANVSFSQGSVTLDIPAADVNSNYTLDITTSGSVSGPAGLQFAWYKQ
jgi:hypothetical protein